MTEKLTFIFDHENPNWRVGSDYNEFFLKGIINFMNHRLRTFGHVFLNEFLDAVGIDRTRSGQVEGWKTGGQGFVNIEMEPVDVERNTTPDIRLTIVTDGNVLDALDEEANG